MCHLFKQKKVIKLSIKVIKLSNLPGYNGYQSTQLSIRELIDNHTLITALDTQDWYGTGPAKGQNPTIATSKIVVLDAVAGGAP